MSIPADRRYSESHEWYQANGKIVTLGITQYAADSLTDITFVQLPAVGKLLKAGAAAGEIESVKATSELYCAVAGKVVEVNTALADHPELVNEDAFGKGWMVRIEAADLGPLDGLLEAKAYAAKLG